MAQTIKLKRSSVSGNTPSTSDLELGEVAINTYDGKMFIKKNDGSDSIVEIGGNSGTVTEAFKTIAVSGQSSVVADSATDTLTLVAGSNMTLTTNASGDTITFASSGGGGTQNVFTTFAVSGQSSVVADSTTDTLTLVAGSGITLSTDNSADSITIAATASAITVQDEGSALSTSATTLNFVGAGVTATGTGATKTITIPGTGTVSEAFKTIAVSGQSNVVADGATDTLTLAAGSGMTITTNASNDTITFASSGGGGGSQNVFSNIGVSGQGTIQADSTTDTLTFEAGTGISLATDTTNDKLTITATGGASNVANAASSIKEFKYDISSSTTTLTGSDANSNTLAYEAGAIQVFLNGILLDPATDYTASNGTSVVLTDAAVSGDDVQIVAFNRKIVTANVGIDTFTGNGSTTAYTLSSDPVNENNTRVHIDGVYQEKAAYSVSGTTLTFSAAPPNGSSIEVEVGFTQAEIGSTLDFADNAILRIGTGNDLQILHDASNSIIKDTGTGDLQIAASTLDVKNAALNETMIKAIQAGAVELYHNNSKKLETVTGGVTITGTVTATTFSGDLSGTINTATTGTTQSASDNSTKIATTAYVDTAVTNLVDSAPGTLNTLNELAAALGDDANFSTTITNSLNLKVGRDSATGAASIPAGTTAQRPGSPAAGQFRYNSTLNQFEGYTSSWGAIGGGGTNTFTTDVFTASGSSAAFTLTQAVSSPNDCIVHIDGIYQTPTDAYTVSGTTLTFTATPANGRKVVVYSVKAGVSGNNLNIQTFSGNGSATSFTMNVNPINENNTIVHIDGVYQQKTSYSTSGTTISFSAAPANGTTIEVATFTQTEINVPVNDTIDTVHIKDDAVTSAKLGGNLTTPGTLTSTGLLTADAGVAIDNITIDGTEIDLSSGSLTLDVAGSIKLDADSGEIDLQDGGTDFGQFAKSSNDFRINHSIQDGRFVFRGNDGGNIISALTLDIANAGAATFNNSIAAGGNITTGGITINGAGSTISDSSDLGIVSGGDLTLDVTGDIILDADGGDIKFKDGGTHIGTLGNSSNDLFLFPLVSDADFKIFGNDGGSTITALTLDMSNAGAATFNSTITSKTINITGDNHDLIISSNDYQNVFIGNRGVTGTDLDKGFFRLKSEGTNTVVIDTAGDSFFNGGRVGIGTSSPTSAANVLLTVGNTNLAYAGMSFLAGTNAEEWRLYSSYNSSSEAIFGVYRTAGANYPFIVHESGSVGIGTSSPTAYDTNSAGVSADLVVANSGHAGIVVASGTSSDAGIFFGDGGGAAAYRGAVSYVNSQDKLYFKSAGANKMVIDSSGNVGIGTINPITLSGNAVPGLTVSSNGPYVLLQDANNANKVRYMSNNTGELQFGIVGDDGSTSKTEHMRINVDGEVGIGTNNPTRKLHVVSTGSATYSGTGSGSNIALHLANLESGAAGRTIGIGMSSETNAEVYLNCVTASNNNGGDFVIASRNAGARAEKMRLHAAGSVTKPLNPSFQARYPAVTAGGGATIVFSGTHHNIGSHYNTSNGIFTAPVAGSYLFTFQILMDPSGTNHYARVLFAKNGTTASTDLGDTLESADYDVQQEYQTQGMSMVIYLNANDTIRLRNNGNTPTYGTGYGAFSGCLLG